MSEPLLLEAGDSVARTEPEPMGMVEGFIDRWQQKSAKRALTKKLSGLVQSGNDCMENGVPAGDIRYKFLHGEAELAVSNYLDRWGGSRVGLLAGASALDKLERMANGSAAEPAQRIAKAVIGVILLGFVLAVIMALWTDTYHLGTQPVQHWLETRFPVSK